MKTAVRKDALSSLIEAQDEEGTGLSHEDLVAAGLVLIVGGWTHPLLLLPPPHPGASF
jgi:cytochrome P450